MSLFSLCMISSILRGLPHWPLLAGLLIPGFGTRASNDASQILATTQLDRFVAPEPPPVEFDLNRPQGPLKSVLFVVVRDKGHFPIENIQITVGTIGGNEATQQADEGWAAFELGRNGPYHGSLQVTVSDPSALLTVEDLKGATVDLALLVDAPWDLHSVPAAEERHTPTPTPIFLHGWRLSVSDASLTSAVSAWRSSIPLQLGYELRSRG